MSSKILVVDDDEDWLVILRDFLEYSGYECSISTDTMKARNDLWSAEHILVISDYQMPGESGLEFLRYISSVYPKIPFVLLTSSEDRSLRSKAIRMGAHCCLSKSINFGELLRAILEATDKKDLPEIKYFSESYSIPQP